MSEVLLPTWIIPEEETHEWLDEGSSVFAAAFAPGLAQRQSYGGLRLKLSRKHTVRGEEKAQLLSALAKTRGRYNVLRTKIHFALRGAISSTESLVNNTFANGTTGWASGSQSALSVADRVARHTRTGAGLQQPFLASASFSVTPYAPYVARLFALQGAGSFGQIGIGVGSTSTGTEYGSMGTTGYGMKSLVAIPLATPAFFTGLDLTSTGIVAGDYLDIPYVSFTQCPLVDNGLNSLLQSDELDTTWTATRASVDDQAAGSTAPDGLSTADSIIEDATASNSHFVSQSVTVSAAAGDYAFSVAVKAGARTWVYIQLLHATGTATVWLNLSTGALGTVSNGTSWTDTRAFAQSMGDGWYKLSIVARKTSAATSISCIIAPTTADAVQTYTGDGASNIYAWRATFVQSSVPGRLVATTTTASTGTSQTGNELYVKGLDASTNGLLLRGDWFEINGELKQATAALNSDAAGLGHLQFEPALIRSPANDDPVIALDPMGKFLVSNIKIDNQFGTQATVTYDLEHIYE